MSATLREKIFRSATYSVRLAACDEEIQLAQRLRFEVFNLELNEGLAESFLTGKDCDPFDPFCDHLLVVHEHTGRVVGTYRLQTGQTAALHLGYYSAQEFDFAPFEDIRCQLVELGRACVHQDHRNAFVLGLLWKGIAQYAVARKARYLIGCSSLTSQNPALGAATYEFLKNAHLAPPKRRTRPLEAFSCAMDALLNPCPPPPKLLRTYLGMGAKICGAPALDREFGTIDFLTFLDLEELSPSSRQHFMGF